MTYITDLAFKNVLASSTTHTSIQNAGAWNQIDAIDGSVVTYTPVSSSSKIVYEISFYADSQSRINAYNVNLQESSNSGSSWSTLSTNYVRNFGISSDGYTFGQDQRFYLHYQFIIPSWSGTKMLRTTITGFHNYVTDASLHKITDWDGTSGTRYCNTSVLVHEV